MSLPFFAMYPKDFEAMACHLSLEEDGAYNRLLRIVWMGKNCKISNDDILIRRRMRVDQDTYDRVVLPIINEFFVRSNRGLTHPRLNEEFKKAKAAHKKAVLDGKKGAAAKALKEKEKTLSHPKATLKPALSNQNQNQNQSKKVTAEAVTKKLSPKEMAAEILYKCAGKEAVDGFLEMRWKIKAPVTERAAHLIFKKLTGRLEADSILDLSTINNWKGVFPESDQIERDKNEQHNQNNQKPAGVAQDAAINQITRLAKSR